MKRIAAAMALFFIAATPGVGLAATIRPIDQDGLNLRAGPGTGYQVVATLAAGQSLKVVGEKDGWFQVQTPAGQVAWAAGWVARLSFEDEQVNATVDTDVLNLRQEPKLTAPVLTVLKQNEQVRLLEVTREWWRVRTAGGLEGWVAASYMKRDPIAPPAPEPATPQPPAPQTPSPQPPTPQPPTPQPPAPQPPAQQPPANLPPVPQAPASAVPVLPLLPPAFVLNTTGTKQVLAARTDTLYAGRNRAAFDWTGSIKAGEPLAYLDAAEGWVKVETPRKERGWVPGTSLTLTEGRLLYEITEGRWTVGMQAPAGAPPASQPGGKYVERRYVNDPEGLRLRQKPEGTIITVLPQGEVLEIQALAMPWIQVKTEKGLVGWVHVDYTSPYTPPPAAPKPALGSDLKATLTATGGGIITLTVEAPGKSVGAPVADGDTLRIPLATGVAAPSVMPVGTGGAKTLSVTGDAILLSLESMPQLQVTQNAPGKLTLVLRPAVSAATATEMADRTVYQFKVAGPIQPRTRLNGADLLVEFPGATPAWSSMPNGLRLQATDLGVQAVVSTRRPYALKRVPGGYELHVYKPGLAGKTILLDPGHGGLDGGASNAALGLREKEINLQVALRLRALLASKGANVLMTRSTDTRPAPAAVLAQGPQDDLTHVDLGYRTRMANELKVDLFLSIHQNCCEGAGTETYFTSGTLNGDRSAQFARLLQKEVPAGLGQIDRGAQDDLMYVTRTTDAPAALLELAFLSHQIEGRLLGRADYQEQAVRLIAGAIEKFFAER